MVVVFFLGAIKMEQTIPKRRHIKFRRRGTAQKKKNTTFRTQRQFEIREIHGSLWKGMKNRECLPDKRRWENNIKIIIKKWA